ncbi:MAG TPA: hypothetical protein PKY77_22125 [Phycisphaerae bacterium]|nr:hypothetical protein [Phycisphaerae bacterium]
MRPQHDQSAVRLPPMKAAAIAQLVAGPQRAKVLKRAWSRPGFCLPLQPGSGGHPHYYDPIKMIKCAVAAGHVTASEAAQALDVLQRLART